MSQHGQWTKFWLNFRKSCKRQASKIWRYRNHSWPWREEWYAVHTRNEWFARRLQNKGRKIQLTTKSQPQRQIPTEIENMQIVHSILKNSLKCKNNFNDFSANHSGEQPALSPDFFNFATIFSTFPAFGKLSIVFWRGCGFRVLLGFFIGSSSNRSRYGFHLSRPGTGHLKLFHQTAIDTLPPVIIDKSPRIICPHQCGIIQNVQPCTTTRSHWSRVCQ